MWGINDFLMEVVCNSFVFSRKWPYAFSQSLMSLTCYWLLLSIIIDCIYLQYSWTYFYLSNIQSDFLCKAKIREFINFLPLFTFLLYQTLCTISSLTVDHIDTNCYSTFFYPSVLGQYISLQILRSHNGHLEGYHRSLSGLTLTFPRFNKIRNYLS